jgi:4,5-dihydroxyphthalate decarboxylase
MAPRPLQLVTRPQGNNRALLDGEIEVAGYRFEHVKVTPLVAGFRRMVRELAFEVCEMALTTYLCAREHGAAFTALPIFLVRGLHHEAIIRPAGSELTPTDLRGQRVGVNRGYTVTTGVWARGLLADEFGLDPDTVWWVPSGDEHVEAYRPPEHVHPELGLGLGRAVATGHLATAVGLPADAVDGVEPMFVDATERGLRAVRERGTWPINHCIVVRDDLLETDPDLANAIQTAFTASKDHYVARLPSRPEEAADPTDRLYVQVGRALGGDPLPYGLHANRHVLEELLRHATTQGILRTRPDLEDVFLDTEG